MEPSFTDPRLGDQCLCTHYAGPRRGTYLVIAAAASAGAVITLAQRCSGDGYGKEYSSHSDSVQPPRLLSVIASPNGRVE